ncbi:hypothetical protein RQP46_002937 [Phenoliferia psychrophenolica]
MIEQQPQLNEPDPASPSPAVAQATPATKSSTPTLPPELVADIIDLAVELLVEEERDLASQTPITNHFLLSAMLVDRVWRQIAVSALLKNGLVTPASVELFIAQVKSHQLEPTLQSVRFGLGSAGLDDARDSSGDDAQFDALVGSLPGLKRLEIVGEGLYLRKRLPTGYQKFDQVLLSNSGPLESNILYKLERNPPSKLLILETRPPSKEAGPASQTVNPLVRFVFLHRVEEVLIFSNQIYSLAAHLEILHYFATTGVRPRLTSLHVLSYPECPEYKPEVTLEEAQHMLLELVNLPVLAKLKVPACWRSDAVEGACEAKGVNLQWV